MLSQLNSGEGDDTFLEISQGAVDAVSGEQEPSGEQTITSERSWEQISEDPSPPISSFESNLTPSGLDLLLMPSPKKRVKSASATPPYELVDNMIVLKNPKVVNVQNRIQIFRQEFGARNRDGEAWTRDEVVSKFVDLSGHGKMCLIHNLVIKGQGGWHCKGTGVTVCAPCKSSKVAKLIGSHIKELTDDTVDHTGGIPRMILDLAGLLYDDLTAATFDYRDLQLIFTTLTDLGLDMSSCKNLWNICCEDAEKSSLPWYLYANKRFYGLLMFIGHRPKSDNVEHSDSKGLANLWHPTKIWKDGKYVKFAQTSRYKQAGSKDGSKAAERAAYKSEVMDKSVEHVKKHRSDWRELAEMCWKELMLAHETTKKSTKKSKKRKLN